MRRRGPLEGEVVIPGAKNSALKLMAASVMARGTTQLTNVPRIADVGIMADLLAAIGMRTVDHGDGTLTIDNDRELVPVAPAEHVGRIRASINVLGPLVGLCGRVEISAPGGDDFGERPIDLHVKGLEAMGAEFDNTAETIRARVPGGRLHGASISLEFPSVGATENLVTAAVHARGTTTIHNAAREPEIQDLCHFLAEMGARVYGAGTQTITVEGVDPGTLRPSSHAVIPDRIQAATYLAAVAVSGGELILRGARGDHMAILLNFLTQAGAMINDTGDGLGVWVPGRLRAGTVRTLPYPGFSTDYKPLTVTMLTVADGTSIVTENLYPDRFRYVDELRRMGADVVIDGHHAVVRGVESLHGTEVQAFDIRAGAAMVVAGLVADGETTIRDVHHIDRGYEDLVGRLAAVGADVERVTVHDARD